MKRASLLVALTCAAAMVQAQDVPAGSFGAQQVRQLPLDCLQRVAPVLVDVILESHLVAWLEGFGQGRKLPPGWKSGEPHFDAAREVLVKRMRADQQARGTFGTIDMRERFAIALNRASALEQQQIAAFLASPEGRFAWTHIIDGAVCLGIVHYTSRRQMLVVAAHERLLGDLQKELAARRAIHDQEIGSLTPVQLQSIDTHTKLIVGLLKSSDEKATPMRFGFDGRVVFDRLGPDLGGALPEVLAFADEFAMRANR